MNKLEFVALSLLACVVVGAAGIHFKGEQKHATVQPVPRPVPQPAPLPPAPPTPTPVIAPTCPETGENDCKCGCLEGRECTCVPPYSKVERKVYDWKQNVAIFVNTNARKIKGLMVAKQEKFCWDKSCIERPCIIAAFWKGNDFVCYVLSPNATDSDIRGTIEQQRPFNPLHKPAPIQAPPPQAPMSYYNGRPSVVCRT